MKNKINKLKGFTLVELLIVIALIAILSVAVLATINPIEQANKARDAAMKNDAAEVLGALERYYTGQNAYPWNLVSWGEGVTVESGNDVLLNSNQAMFGIVEEGGEPGELIKTSELKSSFMSKKPFLGDGVTKTEDILWIYHNGTTNSNYVCYSPMAKANREAAKAVDLKCVNQDVLPGSILNQGEGACAIAEDWSYGPDASVANVVCVPEGQVQ